MSAAYCKRGHLRTPENLTVSGRCRVCIRERRQRPEVRERQREADRRWRQRPEVRERRSEAHRRYMRKMRADPSYVEYERAEYRRRYATDPEFRQRRYEQTRNRYANDPEWREHVKEYHRFWNAQRRRRNGASERSWGSRSHRVTDHAERIMLDPAPLLRAIDESDLTWGRISRATGLDSRTLHRLKTGESRRVRIDVADKIAVLALGMPLALVCPDYGEE